MTLASDLGGRCGQSGPRNFRLPGNGGRAADGLTSSTLMDGRPDFGGSRFVREVLPLTGDLVGRARGLTGQRADAEDLVQETLLKAFASFASFREGTNVRAWLLRIMVNAWVDGHRAGERRPREVLLAEVTDQQVVGWGRQVSSSVEGEALSGWADEVLRSLPEDVRAAVFYADVQGYRKVEIAEMLDVPVGTVRSRLHRGRTRLRELLPYSGEFVQARSA